MSVQTVEQAITNGRLEDVTALLREQPELALAATQSGVSALMLALYHGKAAIAEALAAAVDDLPWFEAVALGRLETVIAQHRAQPEQLQAWSADGFQALHLAAFFARKEVLNYLLSQHADPNQRARQPAAMTALHSAAASRQADLVIALLQAGADPNLQQGGGFTALMSAALHGNLAMIDALLAAGADPALRAEDGRSAAAMAEQGGHAEARVRLESASCG